ncbi:MAG TPA: heme-binding protein [Pseudomonadaceae bacterium]|nr:heme-binding protein [Pseudomonadaceae bacterium]
MSTNYGPSVNLEQTKLVLAAAEAEATKQGWTVCVAVVDTAGDLVGFIKRDDTQSASVLVAQDKARTAALYKRPSKAFQDMVAGGGLGLRVMTMRNVIAAEGGVPLVVDGKIIGAVGVSGVNSDQDGIVATAGAAALG